MKPHSLGFTFPSNYLKSLNVNCTGLSIKYLSILFIIISIAALYNDTGEIVFFIFRNVSVFVMFDYFSCVVCFARVLSAECSETI